MGIKLKQMNTYTHGHRHREARTGSSQKSTVTNPSKGDISIENHSVKFHFTWIQ